MQNLVLSTLLFLFSVTSFGATFEIDPAHTSVTFKVRHLVSKTAGRFEKFKGTIQYEKEKPESWMVEAEVQTASINTDNKKRDEHLRSPDFFDVKKHPTIKLKSVKVDEFNPSYKEAKLHAEMTMLGVTKPVVFNLEVGGEGVDPWGNQKIGFTAKTKINRKDFGMTWNKALDAGGVLLGEEVEIVLEVEADAKVAKTETKAKK